MPIETDMTGGIAIKAKCDRIPLAGQRLTARNPPPPIIQDVNETPAYEKDKYHG
jgi:hypothetical protein